MTEESPAAAMYCSCVCFLNSVHIYSYAHKGYGLGKITGISILAFIFLYDILTVFLYNAGYSLLGV